MGGIVTVEPDSVCVQPELCLNRTPRGRQIHSPSLPHTHKRTKLDQKPDGKKVYAMSGLPLESSGKLVFQVSYQVYLRIFLIHALSSTLRTLKCGSYWQEL